MADDASPPITRALLSVSDKTGLIEFGAALADMGVEILSTGGTARALRDAAITVIDVAEHTGFPEMLDGRVKTLHPTIHGGILGRRDLESHRAAMAEHGIAPIDLVAINLYPFEQTVAGGAGFDDCIENIDIGGPALIRSAAKNHAFVAVLTDPASYTDVIAEMRRHKGGLTDATRRKLAAGAYARTATYDAAVATWFAARTGEEEGPPKTLLLSARRLEQLRYGENPHQRAAFYATGTRPTGLAAARQVQGKALSYNNLNDADAALGLIQEFTPPVVAIIKHANPCGVATGTTLAEAYARARACDPTSAFGGIIAVNRTLDAAAAEAITSLFAEVVIAPDADAPARAVFAAKKNLRLLLTGDNPAIADAWALRAIAGGLLVQDRDERRIGRDDLKVVTERAPTEAEIDDLLFAFAVCKHVKSNAIIYAKDGATVGIGAGQMSRVDSARIAVIKAAEAAEAAGEAANRIAASVVASDAFFPFADGLVAAAEAGATAVIQPGGSVRDEEVIAEANRRGLAMVMTGIRHFRH